jgi:hypothetical protein
MVALTLGVDPSRGSRGVQPSETTESRTLRDLPRRREQRAAARSQPATRPRCRRRAASMSAEPCRGGYGAKPGSRMGAEANACARRFVDSPAAPGSDRLSDPAAAAENPHRFAFAGAPPGTPGNELSAGVQQASPGRTPSTSSETAAHAGPRCTPPRPSGSRPATAGCPQRSTVGTTSAGRSASPGSAGTPQSGRSCRHRVQYRSSDGCWPGG